MMQTKPKEGRGSRNADVRRAIGWLAEAGFSIAPATRAGVTEYAITDPAGAVVRLTPAGLVEWHRIAGE
jgi:hypothetical protein